jgi:hypothetical protein
VSGFRIYEPSECGKDGYPLAWHDWIGEEPPVKDLVRIEAGDRCVRCGHPYRKGEHGNGEWTPCDEGCSHGGPVRWWSPKLEVWLRHDEKKPMLNPGVPVLAQWRILTVHHLTGNKRDLRWWNLAALCQRCHLQIQGRVKMEQVYPHEHSEWFKPYAAGYYAATYLNEDLTREQTMERLDDLLALELAA